jgi:hypothetical protein
LQSPSHVTLPCTFLLAKDTPHVLPWASLNLAGGEALTILLLIFFPLFLFLFPLFSLPFYPPPFLRVMIGSLGSDSEKAEQRLRLKVPKWTDLIRLRKSSRLLSTLFLLLAFEHSSRHSWKRVSTAYRNLLQNFASVLSFALKEVLHLLM